MTEYLRRGSKGEEVRLLQKGIAVFGNNITGITKFDESFGPATELTLKTYQSQNKLAMTGIYDAETQAILAPNIDYMFIRKEDMDDYANELGVESAALKAVYSVESRGDGFTPRGNCVILYEGHIFYRLYEKAYGTTKVLQLARQYPTLIYKDWTSKHYQGGDRENQRLEQAKRIHEEIALQSASWGLFQVMGFNYAIGGYKDVFKYEEAMNENEFEQFHMGCSFIRNDRNLLNALRAKNWSIFARIYNGPGYAKNSYHTKMAAAYAQHQRDERIARG